MIEPDLSIQLQTARYATPHFGLDKLQALQIYLLILTIIGFSGFKNKVLISTVR